ncbi:hypothetical protein GCM10027321_34300 [Massilia terrae]|uniref:Uncharacterized protein n=1 Tax=Massilia terrae TaxID=1811224 RepID=A0ABT2CVU0_9BURK|nr:hypothetical protein [Massilia terrae]MCS0658059.1 hypothetical protein [Massilia terrae]
MYDADDKTTTLIVKLNRLTSLGEINWRVEPPPRTIVRRIDDHIPVFLRTLYKDRQLGLFQQRYQTYDDERDRFYWSERVVLAILDSNDEVLLEIANNSSALNDLFDTVRRKVADVDSIIDDLISDADEDSDHPLSHP